MLNLYRDIGVLGVIMYATRLAPPLHHHTPPLHPAPPPSTSTLIRPTTTTHTHTLRPSSRA